VADPDDVAVRSCQVCTGVPFTVVPLVEPRSARVALWPSQVISRCRRETPVSGSRKSASWPRPTTLPPCFSEYVRFEPSSSCRLAQLAGAGLRPAGVALLGVRVHPGLAVAALLAVALLAVALVVVALLLVVALVVALLAVALLVVAGLRVPLLGVALLVVAGLRVPLLGVTLLVVPWAAGSLLVVPGLLRVALLGVALLLLVALLGVALLVVALLAVPRRLLGSPAGRTRRCCWRGSCWPSA
jgi:hypothetical protein